MPSISEWRQPYRLSNFDLVTESLTLIAGNSSSSRSASWYRRCTPVVVSSVTPLMPAAIVGPPLGVFVERPVEQFEDDVELLGVGRRRVGRLTGTLVLDTLVHQQRRIAAIVQDHVGAAAVRPQERLLGAPPVLLQGLALPREHRNTLGIVGRAIRADCDRRRGVVLRREDVAADPAHLRAERDQRLDQHRGLDRHVERPHDPRPRQRLRRAELLAHGHQARHLVLRELDLLAPELRE